MITLPTRPRITQAAVLVSAAVLIILGLIAYGAVRNVQAQRQQAVQAALQRQQADATKQAQAASFAQVQSALNIQTNKAEAACSVLRQYAAAAATKKLVQYPPVCNLP